MGVLMKGRAGRNFVEKWSRNESPPLNEQIADSDVKPLCGKPLLRHSVKNDPEVWIYFKSSSLWGGAFLFLQCVFEDERVCGVLEGVAKGVAAFFQQGV